MIYNNSNKTVIAYVKMTLMSYKADYKDLNK